MEGRKFSVFGREIVIQSSPRLVKLALIVLIVLSMAALGALWVVRAGILSDTEDMRQEAAALIDANGELKDKIEDVDSVQGILEIAGSELGLVDPDTVIIQPTDVTQPTEAPQTTAPAE